MTYSALEELRRIRAQETTVKPEFVVKDIINELPVHPERKWSTRTISKIEEVIVHQSAMDATVEEIAKYHITPTSDRDGDGKVERWERNHLSDKGAPAIAYHYAIDKDGTIYQCNELSSVTWHAKGHNTKAIGILVVGYFKGPDHESAGEPTALQQKGLVWLLNYIKKELPNLKYIGHSEINEHKPACPGYTLMKVLTEWRNS